MLIGVQAGLERDMPGRLLWFALVGLGVCAASPLAYEKNATKEMRL